MRYEQWHAYDLTSDQVHGHRVYFLLFLGMLMTDPWHLLNCLLNCFTLLETKKSHRRIREINSIPT